MGAADPFGKLRACFSRRGWSYHGLRDHPMTLRLGWFSSGRGPGSRRLLATVHDEVAAGRLDASIAFVFGNREPGQDPQTDLFLEQARGYGLPLVCLSRLRFRRGLGESPARAGDPLWRAAERRGVGAVRAEDGEENALFREIRRLGVARELSLVVETLRAFAEGRVSVRDKRVVDAAGRQIAGYDLTTEIRGLGARPTAPGGAGPPPRPPRLAP